MGKVIPFRRGNAGTTGGDGDRWCSLCGARRDALPTCAVCGAAAWQSYPLAATSGAATFSANLNASSATVTWLT